MALGGTKPSYIWAINGSRWYIIDSIAGNKILAEAYGSISPTLWNIPKSQFDAEFTEAKDVRYISDVLQHQPIAGWSSRLLRSGYEGSAINVRREIDNTNTDIGFLDNYGFDVPSFNAFVGGYNGFSEILYDQFNSWDLLQATNSRQPVINPTGASNNRPAITYDGANCFLRNNSLAVPFQGVNIPFAFCVLFKHSSPNATNGLLSFGAVATSNHQYYVGLTSAPTFQWRRKDFSGTDDNNTFSAYSNAVNYVYSGYFDGISTWIFINGILTKITDTVLGQITPTKFVMGARDINTLGLFFDGDINEALLWNVNIGTKDLLAADYNMKMFYGVY